MAKADDIRTLAAQRVRELMGKASGWEQLVDVKSGSQNIDLLLKFKMGDRPHAIAIGVTSLGQPRQIRETVTRLSEIRREMPEAYPVAVSPYISPQSAALLKRSGLGYLDLSGNCYLSFENVLIEKEGKPNLRPSTRPLKSLFAPRATRVVRVMLVDPQHAWRLEELSWVERNGQQRIQLARPGDLLDAWVEAYSYRQSDVQAYFSPERITRGLVAELGRAAHEARRRYAFTLHSGAALVAPNVRFPAIHCYLEGDPEPVAKALGLRPGEGEGNVYLLAPYDTGVFYAPMAKGGLPVVCLPQLYADLYHYERRGREQAAHLRREAMGY